MVAGSATTRGVATLLACATGAAGTIPAWKGVCWGLAGGTPMAAVPNSPGVLSPHTQSDPSARNPTLLWLPATLGPEVSRALVLADEPTAALDGRLGRQVMDLFRKVAHEQRAGIIVVTHDHRALDVFDRVFEMEDGLLRAHAATPHAA